jgi:hypothetical protein
MQGAERHAGLNAARSICDLHLTFGEWKWIDEQHKMLYLKANLFARHGEGRRRGLVGKEGQLQSRSGPPLTYFSDIITARSIFRVQKRPSKC